MGAEALVYSSLSRRQAIVALAASVSAAWTAGREVRAQAKTRIDVYKDPSCGCCSKWVDHMNANGFDARVIDGDTRAIKTKYGIGPALQSCHTGVVAGLVIEGHVPAADVKRLLASKPAGTIGLTIPGMPQSAPGMDLRPFEPYTVLAFDKQGRTTVFVRHNRA